MIEDNALDAMMASASWGKATVALLVDVNRRLAHVDDNLDRIAHQLEQHFEDEHRA